MGAMLARSWGGLAAGDPIGGLAFVRGHWVDVWFLNSLRPRLSMACGVQGAARLAVWFVGGIGLAIGMRLTDGIG